MDYGKGSVPKGGRKEPRNKTVDEHQKGKPGGEADKAALLARMKAAAEAKRGE